MGATSDPPRRGGVTHALLRIVREAISPFIWLMAQGHRFGRVLLRTEYRLTGTCRQRGACCQHILIEWSPVLERHRWLGHLMIWKHTRLYSFYDKGFTWEVQEGLHFRVLGCRALREDGRCGEYRLRPLFCRTYPQVPLIGRPHILRGCGYRGVSRDGEGAPVVGSELVQLGGRGRTLSAVPPKFNPTKTSESTRLAK